MNQVQATKIVQMLAAVAVTGGATATATVDTIGYDYASFVVNVAVATTPSMTALPVISILESATTDSTNFATITADLGTITSASRQYIYHVDKRASRKRYFKVSVTRAAAGTDGSGPVAIAAILSKPELAPASTADMIGSTNDVVTLL